METCKNKACYYYDENFKQHCEYLKEIIHCGKQDIITPSIKEYYKIGEEQNES